MEGAQLLPVVAALVLVSTSPLVAAAGPPHLEGIFDTTGTIRITGAVSVHEETEGVLHFRSPDAQGTPVRLEAERIQVTSNWERGHDVDVLGSKQKILYPGEQGEGQVHRVFDLAWLNVTSLAPDLEVLVVVPHDSGRLWGDGVNSDVRAVNDETLTRIGWSDDQVGAKFVGYHYQVPGRWVGAFGLDEAVVTGSFTLVVHNGTLHIEGYEQESKKTWVWWTGYEANETAPGVAEFETRVTTIEVTNGVLRASVNSGLDIIGAAPVVEVEGTIRSEQVNGDLQTSEIVYHYDPAPLELRGSGSLAPRSMPGAQPRLEVRAAGGFEVRQTVGLSTIAPTTRPSLEQVSWDGVVRAVAVIVVVLVLAWVAWSQRPRVAVAVAQWRNYASQKASVTASLLEEEEAWVPAARWHREAARWCPDDSWAWRGTIQALVNAREYRNALETFRRACTALRGSEPTVLYGAIQAAWALALRREPGMRKRTVDLMVELGQQDREVLHGLLWADDTYAELRTHRRLIRFSIVRVINAAEDPAGEGASGGV